MTERTTMTASYPTDLGEMDAEQLSHLFGTGEASPVEAARAALDRIERFNPSVNAFAYVVPDMALAAARQSEQRWRRGEPLGPLDGIPATIKELTPVIGIPTRKGSALGESEPAKAEPLAVQRLRDAGVSILGTTSSPELGWKGVTHGPATGATVNPWHRGRAAGGSSGGAAVAAALNMGVIHDGSDGAGSIRIPASFCGVFGFKPTYGWIPPSSTTPHFELAHRGPIARKVGDAALFLQASAGYTPHAAFGYCPPQLPDWRVELQQNVSGLRVGYSRSLRYADVSSDVAAAVDRAAARLVELGCIVEEAEPGFSDPHDSLTTLWSVALANVVKSMQLTSEQKKRLDPGLLELARSGVSVSADAYVEARMVLGDLRVHMARFHQRYDALLLPTMPIVAFDAGHDVPPGSGMKSWTEWSPFTYPFNMTSQPAASVPCGMDKDGMPVGMQLVGAWYGDGTVLRIAHAYQEAFGQPFPSAPRA